MVSYFQLWPIRPIVNSIGLIRVTGDANSTHKHIKLFFKNQISNYGSVRVYTRIYFATLSHLDKDEKTYTELSAQDQNLCNIDHNELH